MKINRLLEITQLLLRRGNVTAKELAERFQVSTRTIYRDVEVLSTSGIPVYATPGTHGGIALLESFALERAMLSEEERESVLLALQALQTARFPMTGNALDKLSALFQQQRAPAVQVDFSTWGGEKVEHERMLIILKAIFGKHTLAIRYASTKGEDIERVVEPFQLLYRGNAWYLLAYCRMREEYRTFRISRMRILDTPGEAFTRDPPPRELSETRLISDSNRPVVLRFQTQILHRVLDEYEDVQPLSDGRGCHLLTLFLPREDWVSEYILGFGPYAEVLSPPDLRKTVYEKAVQITKLYSDC